MKQKQYAFLFALFAWGLTLLEMASFVEVRHFDDDEFEHLSCAFDIANGTLPFVDFFEHHSPLFWFLLSSFCNGIAGAETMIDFRYFMMLMALAGAVLWTGVFARKTSEWAIGALMLWPVMSMMKLIEIRPDVPAFFLSGLSFYLLSKGGIKKAFHYGGILAFGLMILFQPKFFFLFPAVLYLSGERMSCLKDRLLSLLFFLVPSLLFSVYLLFLGLFAATFRHVVLLNANWPEHFSMLRYLAPAWKEAPAFYVLGICGALYSGFRSFFTRRNEALPMILMFCSLLILALVPNPYPQTFLPLWPALCGGIMETLRRASNACNREENALTPSLVLFFILGPLAFTVQNERTPPDPNFVQAARLERMKQLSNGSPLSVLNFIRAHPGHKSSLDPSWCHDAVIRALEIDDINRLARNAWKDSDIAFIDHQFERNAPQAADWLRARSLADTVEPTLRVHGTTFFPEDFVAGSTKREILRDGLYTVDIIPPLAISVNGNTVEVGQTIHLKKGIANIEVNNFFESIELRMAFSDE